MLSASVMTDGGMTKGAIGAGALAGEGLRAFFERDAITVARDLLGCHLSVDGAGGRITEITMLSGKKYAGKMFIDATYEGDLMAAAGVSYHVGRESQAVHHGVHAANVRHA